MPRAEICFTIVSGDRKTIVTTYDREYRSLMILIKEKIFTEDFGECGGMGRCGTCLVSIENHKGSSFLMNRNQDTTLARIGATGPFMHLACQVMINDDLNGAVISMP